jgi:hypothetical protein
VAPPSIDPAETAHSVTKEIPIKAESVQRCPHLAIHFDSLQETEEREMEKEAAEVVSLRSLAGGLPCSGNSPQGGIQTDWVEQQLLDLPERRSQDFSTDDMVENIYPLSPASNIQSPSDRAYPQIFERDRAPPRNAKNEIFCDHSECADKQDPFTRTCEWNKHMDKHERPYKCLERGCEHLPGFHILGSFTSTQ